MNIGITFGGYCPLHQGHLDLIMRAKKENERCYVVVCGYDDEPRAKELGASLEVRYSLIRDFFAQDEQIVVLEVDDSRLGIDESMSDNNWLVWQDAIRRLLPQGEDGHYTWYVSDPFYQQALERLNVLHAAVVLVERRLAFSASDIRRRPQCYWRHVAMPFRRFLSHNILVMGTASEGKSTLVRDVARYHGIPFVEEYARTYMQEHHKVDEMLETADYVVFLKEQNRQMRETVSSAANPGCCIADTDNLVTLMYAQAAAWDPNMLVSQEDYDHVLLPLARQLADTIRWGKIFLLTPKSVYVDDGFRYMGHADMSERMRHLALLEQLLSEFGLSDRVERLHGTKLENYLTVRNYIEEVLDDTKK